MGQHRTKKQKLHAVKQREDQKTYAVSSLQLTSSFIHSTQEKNREKSSLLQQSFTTKDTIRDLQKTMIVSSGILLILLAMLTFS